MPILDLQMRIRELGRIRIGETRTSQNGKTFPSKLGKFRITSASRPLLEKVAQLYGGTVQDWTPQNSNLQQFEVYTESDRLPVLVPPNPVSQWYEHWSGGGCQRRCDGHREVMKDKPCLCGPDPADRLCKPTTRVNVMLREVEGVGVWRLESHGYNAAVELPQAAEFLARAGGYVDGFLTLAERQVVRDGKTSRFMVPALDIGITSGQLLAGGGNPTAGQLGSGQGAPQLTGGSPAPEQQGERRQLSAGPTATSSGKPLLSPDETDMVVSKIRDISTVDDLRTMWREVCGAFHVEAGDPVRNALDAKAAELKPADEQPQTSPNPDDINLDSGTGTSGGDADAAWTHCMTVAPEDWSTTQVEEAFAEFSGTNVEQGTAQQFREFAVELGKRAKAGA